MSEWESYWSGISSTGETGQVFWDVEAEQASVEDLGRFQKYLDPRLPLLDLGCGNGRQSRFFADRFERVVGVDISKSAINLAERETSEGLNVEYRVFDGVQTEQAIALHEEFGDMNVYMRGVFHMIRWSDRPRFVASLGILIGRDGTLYQIELSSKSILHLRSLPPEVFARIPKVMKRVGFNLDERQKFYPDKDWILLEEGDGVFIRSIPLPDGKVGSLPANYLILRKCSRSNV
jgi:SAM-dependent methyltransferase